MDSASRLNILFKMLYIMNQIPQKMLSSNLP